MSKVVQLRPQKGPQEKFLSSAADIVIYGGSAGGGKSWSILLEALRGMNNPLYNAVLFRRTSPMIRNPGGLWDASNQIYNLLGAKSRETTLEWTFPSGSNVVMRHMKLARNMYDWQGSEIVYIAFDELTHFSAEMFWYMLSRNRSTCGIAPYVRATCNPDADSWVRELIDWWIGPDGLAIAERSGIVRHFKRVDGQIVWLDEPDEDSKSFTFINASIFDNQELLRKDPGYLRNLKSLPLVERERLLGGNWNVKSTAGKVFRSDWFPVSDRAPRLVKLCRFWDFAGTVKQSAGDDPDWTVGALLGLDSQGDVWVLDIQRLRGTPAEVDRAFVNTTAQDGRGVAVRWFEDPGQAGIYQSQKLRSLIPGYDAKGVRSQLDKLTRAKPLSRAAEFGEVHLVRGNWNQEFINELAQFPDGKHDDIVDAASGAYQELTGEGVAKFGYANIAA
ncbi:MAG: phage terminase large subunit [Leptolyngbya sp. SIO4C5]|nr:phage terminase large subunit [Leptolyngbya sp. SIO4C5]